MTATRDYDIQYISRVTFESPFVYNTDYNGGKEQLLWSKFLFFFRLYLVTQF